MIILYKELGSSNRIFIKNKLVTATMCVERSGDQHQAKAKKDLRGILR